MVSPIRNAMLGFAMLLAMSLGAGEETVTGKFPRVKVYPATPASAIIRPQIAVTAAKPVGIIVEAVRAIDPSDDISAVVQAVKQVDVSSLPTGVIVDLIEAMELATHKIGKAESIALAEAVKDVKTPEWYELQLYDVGTGLWAIATKARFYAEQGNREKVEELYKYFVKVMIEVENAEMEK